MKAMQLPIILIHSNQSVRNTRTEEILSEFSLKWESPEVLKMEEKLGIESIKQIHNHLFLKSNINATKVIVIDPADSLTPDAQNALLKLLEEPQGNVLFILGITNDDILFQTVVSRCKLEYIQTEKTPEMSLEEQKEWEELLSGDVLFRLEQTEKLEDKKVWLAKMVTFYHQYLKKDPKSVTEVKKILLAQKWMKQNVMPKAIIDYLMISLKQVKKSG